MGAVPAVAAMADVAFVAAVAAWPLSQKCWDAPFLVLVVHVDARPSCISQVLLFCLCAVLLTSSYAWWRIALPA